MTVKHRIEWTYDARMAGVDAKVVCESDDDEVCRTKPSPKSGCDCEEFFGIDRDDLSWFHVVETETEDGKELKLLHRHVPANECNIALFMNEDPMETILEAAADRIFEVVIGSTDITPIWNGDGYDWKPV